jgi:hypothetical protein
MEKPFLWPWQPLKGNICQTYLYANSPPLQTFAYVVYIWGYLTRFFACSVIEPHARKWLSLYRKYMCEFEENFKTALACESGSQGGLFDKNAVQCRMQKMSQQHTGRTVRAAITGL